jgi:chitinase
MGDPALLYNVARDPVSANEPPSIDWISPNEGDSFNAPANMVLQVQAIDPDGALPTVEFYLGEKRLGTVTTPPYAMALTNLTAGTYAVAAIAIDDRLAQTRSRTITFEVSTFRILSIKQSNQLVQITWAGGKPPYTLERKTGLGPNSAWEQVAMPVYGTNAVINPDAQKGFFRVRSTP